MNIKKSTVVDALDVINYVNSKGGKVVKYFIVRDECSTNRLKRIKGGYIYVDSSCRGTSIRCKNVWSTERSDIIDLPMRVSRETIERSWTWVYNDYGTGLDTETFDGMIFIDKSIGFERSLNRDITASIIFFNTSKITFDDTLDIVKIRYTHDDDFENTANKFLSQYANKIRDEMNVLDSELSMKRDEYERELEDMRNEHQSNIESLNSDHDYEISLIENEHKDEILCLRAEHREKIEQIKREYEKELKLLEKLINVVTTD